MSNEPTTIMYSRSEDGTMYTSLEEVEWDILSDYQEGDAVVAFKCETRPIRINEFKAADELAQDIADHFSDDECFDMQTVIASLNTQISVRAISQCEICGDVFDDDGELVIKWGPDAYYS